MKYLLLSLGLLCAAGVAHAQAVNFMDESGNLHFADSVEQVPLRYRDQVLKKRPENLTKEQYREAQKEFKKAQTDIKKKQKLDERNAQKFAKEKARLAGKQKKPVDAKKTADRRRPTTVADQDAVGAQDPLSAKIRKYGQE